MHELRSLLDELVERERHGAAMPAPGRIPATARLAPSPRRLAEGTGPQAAVAAPPPARAAARAVAVGDPFGVHLLGARVDDAAEKPAHPTPVPAWDRLNAAFTRLELHLAAVNQKSPTATRARWLETLDLAHADIGAPGEKTEADLVIRMGMLRDYEEMIRDKNTQARALWGVVERAYASHVAEQGPEEWRARALSLLTDTRDRVVPRVRAVGDDLVLEDFGPLAEMLADRTYEASARGAMERRQAERARAEAVAAAWRKKHPHKGFWGNVLDDLQSELDFLSWLPVFGLPAEVANGWIDIARGKYEQAAEKFLTALIAHGGAHALTKLTGEAAEKAAVKLGLKPLVELLGKEGTELLIEGFYDDAIKLAHPGKRVIGALKGNGD